MNTFEQAVEAAEKHLLKANLFYGHGMGDAYDEAVYAALYCAKLPVDEDIDWEAQYPSAAFLKLSELINARCQTKKPLAYLTREAYLHGYKFYVDERVIVPRSFIGELVLDGFAPWVNPDKVTDVLELCTGSGCLAIMAADTFHNAHIDAIDIDNAALEVAQLNVKDYNLSERISLIKSDLYQAIAHQAKQYDIIFSNPPYVNSESMSNLPSEYLAEPHIALAGGQDGMDLVRTIVNQAAPLLKPNGILVVEIGNEYAHANAAFKQLPLVWLDTSGADNAVFLLTRADLERL
ncbi:50S ribosomal protein L3 N(5)-glutamine methyltransferase [Hydromonas duriensis]|uniref:[LSU ribosomal protein L3P]-glutamine N5-methyltransferase n=1 Tax=Hydromonas duriensis TaxID=1527608 RepID=A0A4R6YA00_9BURK|nr:50S ribosomal protein L3 N(5)-glutamine methyltransferase [Hydromonas duriensis]TDR32294.1 [LSU ribosomal protein L3P]-glutamine N5-methyltransferase [Hydromonas duriensis]